MVPYISNAQDTSGFFSFYLLIDFYFPFQSTLPFSAVLGSHTILSILLLYPLAGGQVPFSHHLSIYSSLTDSLRNGVQPTLLRRKEREGNQTQYQTGGVLRNLHRDGVHAQANRTSEPEVPTLRKPRPLSPSGVSGDT